MYLPELTHHRHPSRVMVAASDDEEVASQQAAVGSRRFDLPFIQLGVTCNPACLENRVGMTHVSR